MDQPSGAPPSETPGDPRYGAFLIRVWANDREGRVRLVVQQVGSTRQTAFADWNGISRHIRDCLARPAPTGRPDRSSDIPDDLTGHLTHGGT
ncbi:MAG: hypothetical protein ABIQ99_06335 [Thermoflexales bacterium]